jgi:hypothetical protein
MFRLLCLIALSRVSGWLSAFVAVQAMGKALRRFLPFVDEKMT